LDFKLFTEEQNSNFLFIIGEPEEHMEVQEEEALVAFIVVGLNV